MARPGRPNSVWWRESHKRWVFSVRGKQHYAPKGIGPDNRRQAELWYRETMAALYPDLPISEPMPRTGRVRKEYLLRVSTVRRLKRLVNLRRKATGKVFGANRVIDGLVDAAIKARPTEDVYTADYEEAYFDGYKDGFGDCETGLKPDRRRHRPAKAE